MNKRISSRAIIIEDNAIIMLFRRKTKDDGSINEYYAIPGGGVESNETIEETVIREIKEELSIDIKILGYLGKVEEESSITHFFHCQKVNGIEKLGGPEIDRNNPSNYYEIKHLKLDQIYNAGIIHIRMIEKALNGDYLR